MKRDNRGAPVMMVQRWSRPPLSCLRCREKKQRCDRNHPCSNCTSRNIECQYAQPDDVSKEHEPAHFNRGQVTAPSPIKRPEPATLGAEETLNRIQRLEEAVFSHPNQTLSSKPTSWTTLANGTADKFKSTTLFGFHILCTKQDESYLDMAYIASQLPPLGQARELFNQFVLILQPNIGIHHIPSTRALMEQTYQTMVDGQEPSPTSLLLLFSIFAGAALSWTPEFLKKINSTEPETKAAFTAYTRLALSILDDEQRPVPPSTVAMEAISTLAHLVSSSNGLPVKLHVLRIRCTLMARTMNIHRLDTVKSCEERKANGCNMIEIEVQRRIWWNMVASDWLNAYSGGPGEGSYVFQTRHMNVAYPSNVDDEFMTPTSIENFPFTTPTSMTAFIYRVKMARLCRELVDAMPSLLLESQEPDYDLVLNFDSKFQSAAKDLPIFFQIDTASIQASEEICRKYPDIAWQRIRIHFSLHTRLCRLHRPYHIEGSTNAKYAYSHIQCIRSAQTVLELRRQMEDGGGFKAARSWNIMEHVFLAALILAADISEHRDAPEAETRKERIMAAVKIVETGKEESGFLRERIQRNMERLMATLHQKRRVKMPSSQSREVWIGSPGEMTSKARNSDQLMVDEDVRGDGIQVQTPVPIGDQSPMGEKRAEGENWDQLWSDFLAISGDLDAPEWNSLLDDMDFNIQPDIS